MIATAMGSMPGNRFDFALGRALELFPELSFWPELPGGPSGDMIRRAIGLLGLPINEDVDGWRLSDKPSKSQNRAKQHWLDEIEIAAEQVEGYPGRIKIAVAGPWTLAASVLLRQPTMNHVLFDSIACRDLAQAFGAGLAELLNRVTKSISCPLVIQLDEPVAPFVRAGQLPSFSGLSRYRIVDRVEMIDAWREVLNCVGHYSEDWWLHCCAAGISLTDLADAGFNGVASDIDQISNAQKTAYAHWLEDGKKFVIGSVPTSARKLAKADQVALRTARWLDDLALEPKLLTEQVILSCACGLGLWEYQTAWAQLAELPKAADQVDDMLYR